MSARRYVVVTGGVSSSLGKGIFTASLGLLLRASGYDVVPIKCDPYLNVDAGTMNPYQHGEVFVTADGGETDLDLGHYERFIGIDVPSTSNITSGKVYKAIIEAERRGDYLGQTVTVIPHVTDMIKSMITTSSRNADVALIEIGGTVGDIEGLAFLEASRQLGAQLGRDRVIYVHVTLVPYLETSQEFKTKPTQHSVKELMRNGITPDLLVLRSSKHLPDEVPKKLSTYTSIPREHILTLPNVQDPYEIPILLMNQEAHLKVLKRLGLPAPDAPLSEMPLMRQWSEFTSKLLRRNLPTVKVAIVGKYVEMKDAYLSLLEALKHAAVHENVALSIEFVDARRVRGEELEGLITSSDGVVVPGGFGASGVEMKIEAIRIARELGVPFLGLCLGFQLAVIEIARNLLGLRGADSQEFNPETPEPVIRLRGGSEGQLGGTMRLGEHLCLLREGSILREIYGRGEIYERFRHRYEFNPDYVGLFENAGVTISALSEDGIPQALEVKEHPFFIAVQFHAEFKSKPLEPSPLFASFVRALKRRRGI